MTSFLKNKIKFDTKGFSTKEILTEKKSLKEIIISKKNYRYSESFSKFKIVKKNFFLTKNEMENNEKFLLGINDSIHKLKVLAFKNQFCKVKNYFNYLPELIE